MVPDDDEKVVVETLTAYLNGVALEALVHGEDIEENLMFSTD